jgi:hypothetical protein
MSLGWLRHEFEFALAKRMTRGYPQDYSARHYPLKTLNGQLSVVQGWPAKAVGKIKGCPFKPLRPPREGWPQDN